MKPLLVVRIPVIIGPAACQCEGKGSQAKSSACYGRARVIVAIIPRIVSVMIPTIMAISVVIPTVVPATMPTIVSVVLIVGLLDL